MISVKSLLQSQQRKLRKRKRENPRWSKMLKSQKQAQLHSRINKIWFNRLKKHHKKKLITLMHGLMQKRPNTKELNKSLPLKLHQWLKSRNQSFFIKFQHQLSTNWKMMQILQESPKQTLKEMMKECSKLLRLKLRLLISINILSLQMSWRISQQALRNHQAPLLTKWTKLSLREDQN